MSISTSILTAGTNGHQTTSEEANRFVTNFVTPGIVGALTNTSGTSPSSGAFAVNAQGVPNKTVTVSVGDAVINATPSTQAAQNLMIRNNAAAALTIADNTSGSTRYDWVYLVVNPILANNPPTDGTGVTSIVVNRSTSVSVDTVGAPAYSEKLAVITVLNGFTSIVNTSIADLRRNASAAILPGTLTAAMYAAGSVGTTALAAGAVTSAKMGTVASQHDATYNIMDLGDMRIISGVVYYGAPGVTGWLNLNVTLPSTGFLDANYNVLVGNMHGFDVEYDNNGASIGVRGINADTKTATRFSIRYYTGVAGNGGGFSYIAIGKKP